MSDELLRAWEKKSGDRNKLYKKYLHRANKNAVLKALPVLHEEAFSKIDCLKCGNCCKSYSPRFKTPDIKRIAKHLKMKDGDLINEYLRVDEDGDYVMRTSPCSFLGEDNYCSIYEVRPDDCAGFPHLKKKKMVEYIHVHQQNISYCPATYKMVEKFQELLKPAGK